MGARLKRLLVIAFHVLVWPGLALQEKSRRKLDAGGNEKKTGQ
jgi:hypothetical protein